MPPHDLTNKPQKQTNNKQIKTKQNKTKQVQVFLNASVLNLKWLYWCKSINAYLNIFDFKITSVSWTLFCISEFTLLGAPDNSVDSENRGHDKDTNQDDTNTEPTQETSREPGQETDTDSNQEWQQDRAPQYGGPNNDIQNSGESLFGCRGANANFFDQPGKPKDPSLEPYK